MKFTGHERDSSLVETESAALDYMHARYYSAQMGRFLSGDPGPAAVDVPQSWNRYSYVLNNPLSLTDPYGLEPCTMSDPSVDGGAPFPSECITVEGKIPEHPTIRGSANSLFDLARWATGTLPRESAADPASARDLANTPVMDQIRDQFEKDGCADRENSYYGDFQYRELAATTPLSTGQMVGSFGAKIRNIGGGLVVVKAFNTWGLESGTRFPRIPGMANNRWNASVQQMLFGGAPLQYPKSLLENRTSGAMRTATLNYIWIEGSPCMQ